LSDPGVDRTARYGAGAGALAIVFVAAVLTVGGCGDDPGTEDAPPDARIEHVHGLGINPADGALFIATHHGLFRSAPGSTEAEPVGTSGQDVMGFTVVGPDRFLGSGHPAPGEDRPPNLGLIESDDAGSSWQDVSLTGEADFHVLRSAHDRVYAFNGLTGKLMLSDDGGESWEERRPPGAVVDLAVDPRDPERILASTDAGLQLSEDDGRSWRRIKGGIGLLAWPAPRALYWVDASGTTRVSPGPGQSWKKRGSIDGQPAAFAASDENELYAALADGTVMASDDGGASWRVRSSP
jgi:hypothetical protein